MVSPRGLFTCTLDCDWSTRLRPQRETRAPLIPNSRPRAPNPRSLANICLWMDDDVMPLGEIKDKCIFCAAHDDVRLL